MRYIFKMGLCGVLFFCIANANAEEKTLPVSDGMILNLGNHIQTVQVRAKSLGPGACAVSFDIKGQSTNFLAPPLKMSPWTDVGPGFTGATSQKLGFSIECDTGAVAEVKFFN